MYASNEVFYQALAICMLICMSQIGYNLSCNKYTSAFSCATPPGRGSAPSQFAICKRADVLLCIKRSRALPWTVLRPLDAVQGQPSQVPAYSAKALRESRRCPGTNKKHTQLGVCNIRSRALPYGCIVPTGHRHGAT